MKILKKIISIVAIIAIIGGIAINFAMNVNPSFQTQISQKFNGLLNKEDNLNVANAVSQVKSELEDKISKLNDEKIYIENSLLILQNKTSELQEILNNTASSEEVEELQNQINSLNNQITNLINERSQIENEIIELRIKLDEISNILGEKRTQAKLLDLKYNLSVTEKTTLGTTTMNFKGGTLIVVGYIYAKISNHICYINLKIDNNDVHELTAFDASTGIMSRPFVFCLSGLEVGNHTFSVEVVGQQGDETITIPNYNRACSLFIEI